MITIVTANTVTFINDTLMTINLEKQIYIIGKSNVFWFIGKALDHTKPWEVTIIDAWTLIYHIPR